ncbi:hypothetical protein EJ02DRAFT_257264 [Clathrospora elynae]|uniref:Secreted protein n=1 Tax=Clathrospora elynae TaxID=706981 RepID=A0A6A5SFF0_9PLEO|nr:hypothetical protein EJ02DRAFT_257264 [Clathrospora elynae]
MLLSTCLESLILISHLLNAHLDADPKNGTTPTIIAYRRLSPTSTKYHRSVTQAVVAVLPRFAVTFHRLYQQVHRHSDHKPSAFDSAFGIKCVNQKVCHIATPPVPPTQTRNCSHANSAHMNLPCYERSRLRVLRLGKYIAFVSFHFLVVWKVPMPMWESSTRGAHERTAPPPVGTTSLGKGMG